MGKLWLVSIGENSGSSARVGRDQQRGTTLDDIPANSAKHLIDMRREK
jgi:hypothetical protein